MRNIILMILCVLGGVDMMSAMAQQDDPHHERLERDIERMRREERREDEAQERSRQRDLLNQGNGVILLNPPPRNGDVIVINPTPSQNVIWAEPIIPSMDRSTIILRGQFDVQPSPSCTLEQWREVNQLYQRWHCP